MKYDSFWTDSRYRVGDLIAIALGVFLIVSAFAFWSDAPKADMDETVGTNCEEIIPPNGSPIFTHPGKIVVGTIIEGIKLPALEEHYTRNYRQLFTTATYVAATLWADRVITQREYLSNDDQIALTRLNVLYRDVPANDFDVTFTKAILILIEQELGTYADLPDIEDIEIAMDASIVMEGNLYVKFTMTPTGSAPM